MQENPDTHAHTAGTSKYSLPIDTRRSSQHQQGESKEEEKKISDGVGKDLSLLSNPRNQYLSTRLFMASKGKGTTQKFWVGPLPASLL